MAAEAWPSAQAWTSWAKSETRPSSTQRSTVTFDPQSLDTFSEDAWGAGSRPACGISAASLRIFVE